MEGHADAVFIATAPSSPTHHLCSGLEGGGDRDEDGGGSHYFFFSAPASPVHYILRSPPASSNYVPGADGEECCPAVGDFEFTARSHRAAGAGMSTAEELFLSGRIRVGCLSPIRQETAKGDQGEDDDDEKKEEVGVDGHASRPRRARSVLPPRSPRLAKDTETPDSLTSASSSSSSSVKNTRRRISLRLLLGRTCSEASFSAPATAVTTGAGRSAGFWLPSIWPSTSRPKKAALPCPAPQPGRRSKALDSPAPAKRSEDPPRRRTTALPYRQGLVLGCLGFGARNYGLAKAMHPFASR